MNFYESLRTALSSLASNKLRSVLTMLGVIIGVAAVVSMVSLGQGARVQITEQIGELGSNVLTVVPGRARPRPGMAVQAAQPTRDFNYQLYSDLKRMAGEKYIPGITQVGSETNSSAIVTYQRENVRSTVVATTPNYPDIQNFHPQTGRFFTSFELENASRVVVLGEAAAEDLFGDPTLALGKNVRVGNVSFTVIGVMEPKSAFGRDLGDRVFMPITTAQRRLTGERTIGNITVQTATAADVTPVTGYLEGFFTRRLGGDDQYSVINQQDILDTIEQVTGTVTLLLAGITGISLLVGGIGIMNIMLVSVTERTREIGLRKALGARPSDIMTQFIIESSTLSGFGGIIGILLGVLGAITISRLSEMVTLVSLESAAIAFLVAVGVGLFFGIFPARRASRLDPITALRYE